MQKSNLALLRLGIPACAALLVACVPLARKHGPTLPDNTAASTEPEAFPVDRSLPPGTLAIEVVRDDHPGLPYDRSEFRPVEGARVTLEGDEGLVLEGRTDALGHVTFEAVPAGTYSVLAQLPFTGCCLVIQGGTFLMLDGTPRRGTLVVSPSD